MSRPRPTSLSGLSVPLPTFQEAGESPDIQLMAATPDAVHPTPPNWVSSKDHQISSASSPDFLNRRAVAQRSNIATEQGEENVGHSPLRTRTVGRTLTRPLGSDEQSSDLSRETEAGEWWQGMSPESALSCTYESAAGWLVGRGFQGDLKVVLTYAGTDAWVHVHIDDTFPRSDGHRVGPSSASPLLSMKMEQIVGLTTKAVDRLCRVLQRIARSLPPSTGTPSVGAKVEFKVFGYEFGIEATTTQHTATALTVASVPTTPQSGHSPRNSLTTALP